MIEYDYEIIRDEGNEKRIFKPDIIPPKLSNLVYIEGKNSIGKSTLLNIIAMGFYGSKLDKKIHKSLLTKINNLLKSNHQKLKFSIKITSNDSKFALVSEKPSFDKAEIIVYEIKDDKKIPLTFERFQREYNLIYDIPDNPTERLKQLTVEIRDAQIRYGNRVGELKEVIHRIISEIRSSRDPNKINNLIVQLDKLRTDIKRVELEKISFEKELDLLEKSTYHKYYTHYSYVYDNKQIKLKQLEKQIKKTVTKEKRTIKIATDYIETCNVALNEMQQIFDKTTELLRKLIPKSEKHLNIWERISINQANHDLEFDTNLQEEIINFKNMLIKIREKKSDKESFQEVKLYQDLIDVLEQYKNFNITIPGLGKSLTEFINELKNLRKGKQKLLTLDTNINEAINLLDQLKEKSDHIESFYFPKLKDLRKDKGIDHTNENITIENDIENLKKELKGIIEKVQYYESELMKKGDFDSESICQIGDGDLEKYSVFTEMQLKNEISAIKDEINKKSAEITKTNFHIERLTIEISDLKKKKPHKYQEHLKELNELLEKTTILETKLRKEFESHILLIIDEKIDEYKNLSGEQINYFASVFNYLGQRVDFIRHLDKDYEVKKIDLIKKVIITKEGKNIMLADMGTGQGQCAYLKGLLNTSDNRKIIALFDEIAMMDNQSLEPICEKFRELYNKNNLLVGILVQMGNEFKSYDIQRKVL